MQFIHLLPIYWAVSGLFIINSGDKTLVALIITSIIVKLLSCVFDENERFDLKINYMIGLVFICAIYASFSYYHNGYSSSEIRVLISVALYSMVSIPKMINYKKLSMIFIFSSLYIVSQTTYILIIQEQGRMQLPLNPLPYSNYCGLLSIISLYLSYKTEKSTRALYISSFVFLFITVIITDSRGTWLAILLAILTTITLLFLKKKCLRTSIISIVLLIFTSLLSYPLVKDRIENTIQEVEFLSYGNLGSSWGIRIQLWMVGYDIISKSPSLVGLGQTEHLKIIQDMYNEGKVQRSLAQFDNKNFHNSIIDRTVKYGLIGLLLYLGAIITPFYYGLVNFKSQESLLLITMPVFIFTAGLSYVPLSHPGTYFLYLITSILLINKIKLDRTHT
ncbi:O-antigen ligase family protein [Vibrio lentus]